MSISVITINRQAVTPPAFEFDADGPKDDRFAIVAEIAERLEELDDLKHGGAADLMVNLGLLAAKSRRAFRITIQLLHRNYDTVLASYEDQAARRNVTKQDIHYEFTQELAAIRPFFPALYERIMATRKQALQHEDPIAKSEVACAGGGGE